MILPNHLPSLGVHNLFYLLYASIIFHEENTVFQVMTGTKLNALK